MHRRIHSGWGRSARPFALLICDREEEGEREQVVARAAPRVPGICSGRVAADVRRPFAAGTWKPGGDEERTRRRRGKRRRQWGGEGASRGCGAYRCPNVPPGPARHEHGLGTARRHQPRHGTVMASCRAVPARRASPSAQARHGQVLIVPGRAAGTPCRSCRARPAPVAAPLPPGAAAAEAGSASAGAGSRRSCERRLCRPHFRRRSRERFRALRLSHSPSRSLGLCPEKSAGHARERPA